MKLDRKYAAGKCEDIQMKIIVADTYDEMSRLATINCLQRCLSLGV